MTASDLTHSPLRELASRVAGGVETTSSWNKDTGALTVWGPGLRRPSVVRRGT
jgi:hypothetical protein